VPERVASPDAGADDFLAKPFAMAERERLRALYRAAYVHANGTPGHSIGLALIAGVAWVHSGSAELIDSARGAHLRIRLPLWTPAHV
jgi:DNA-binding response OmpR family regulator